jgi:lysophospholipase L1-like esterase
MISLSLMVWLLSGNAGFSVTKWACVGDSITAAWKLKEVDSYCYKLGVLLGGEYETSNFGHSARTMLSNPVEGWPYWESPKFTESQAYLPDIVSIMLGTNDAHPNNWPELSVEFYQDTVDMVRVYQGLASKPRVVLMTIPPAKERNSRNDAIVEVNAILAIVAGETGCELADVWHAIENSGLSEREKFKDPIHLDGPAHTVIADLLFGFAAGPVCGDGSCDPSEDECNCTGDCGLPALTEDICSDGFDNDCDTHVDCQDEDCGQDPGCPTCGDYSCEAGENSCTCPGDCGPASVTEEVCQVPQVVFSDDFESGELSSGGWIRSGNAQIQEQAAFTGLYGVKLQRVGSIEKAISTVGMVGLTVEYDRITMKFEPADDSLDVEWFDGNSWHLIESTADTSWGHFSMDLPAGADDNPAFLVRFTCHGNHPVEKVYLDNVRILD